MTIHKAGGGKTYDWLRCVQLSGEAGRRWAEEFDRAEARQVRAWTQQALEHLRHWNLDRGQETLDQAWEGLESLPVGCPSIRLVLRRWYFASSAFNGYCRKRFESAEEDLLLAHRAVEEAIELRGFLLPLAYDCFDFRLQRIRIARNRGRWREMKEFVRLAREVMADQLPLCTLSDGTAIRFSTLGEFYASVPGLEEEEKAAIHDLLDTSARLRHYDHFIRGVYASCGPLIPYP